MQGPRKRLNTRLYLVAVIALALAVAALWPATVVCLTFPPEGRADHLGPLDEQGLAGEPDGTDSLGPDLPSESTGADGLPGFIGKPQATSQQVVHVFSGSMRSTVVVSNPAGITDIEDYYGPNFEQRVISRTFDRVELEITSRRELNTAAPFPVNREALPAEAVEALTPRPNWIQADDPSIIATAQQVVAGAWLQAQAVDAIMAWVRGHLVYDFAGPRDALSAYNTGQAYCVGFANLAMALLRAVGIPARAQYGAVGGWDGWGSPVEGGRHVWVEVYYPDVGWVACDPQATSNFIDTAHIVGFLDQSGKPGTVVQRTSSEGSLTTADAGYLYAIDTGSQSRSGIPLYSANVPGWDRRALVVQPIDVTVAVNPSAPRKTIALNIQAQGAGPLPWRLEPGSSWIQPALSQGVGPTTVGVTVDGSDMPPGRHVSTVKVIAGEGTGTPTTSQAVTVNLQVDGLQVSGQDLPAGDYRVVVPVVLCAR